MAYDIEFAASVRAQLAVLTASQRAATLDAIEKQLVYEPLVETRNRKLLRPNPLAPWELRVGELRVFYEVQQHEAGDEEKREPEGVVSILAIGQKKGNALWIGGKRVEL